MIKIETHIVGADKVHVIMTGHGQRAEFDAHFRPRFPQGHPLRYEGLPRFIPPVREVAKVAIRRALAS